MDGSGSLKCPDTTDQTRLKATRSLLEKEWPKESAALKMLPTVAPMETPWLLITKTEHRHDGGYTQVYPVTSG